MKFCHKLLSCVKVMRIKKKQWTARSTMERKKKQWKVCAINTVLPWMKKSFKIFQSLKIVWHILKKKKIGLPIAIINWYQIIQYKKLQDNMLWNIPNMLKLAFNSQIKLNIFNAAFLNLLKHQFCVFQKVNSSAGKAKKLSWVCSECLSKIMQPTVMQQLHKHLQALSTQGVNRERLFSWARLCQSDVVKPEMFGG